MKTYESHELTPEMAKPAPEGLIDPMTQYREMLETVPVEPVPDDFSRMKIEEVQAEDRIREREELRPITPETPAS